VTRPRTLTTLAPAKINVCLFLGPTRPDGRHDLVSVMQAVSLVDRVTLAPADGPSDEVVCPGVEGDNLAAAALAAFRAHTGWAGAPVRIEIEKRIPVAAGMAGGSADAGAALRLAAHAAGGETGDAELLRIAAGLGADVPGQVRPGRLLATGAGERIEPLAPVAPFGVLVLPGAEPLATPSVYGEADRLGLGRDDTALAGRLAAVRAALPDLPDQLVVNELEPAARSLRPSIGEALDAARAAGADLAIVSGSGPTALGLFRDPAAAVRAAQQLAGRSPAPVACHTVGRDFAAVIAA
jgi:4-diphosphocytidyl-2-C-methyl-D-erythritol kinase